MKQHSRSEERFRKDDLFEDSDCEGTVDPVGHTVKGVETGNVEASGKGTLHVLSIGSFAR